MTRSRDYSRSQQRIFVYSGTHADCKNKDIGKLKTKHSTDSSSYSLSRHSSDSPLGRLVCPAWPSSPAPSQEKPSALPNLAPAWPGLGCTIHKDDNKKIEESYIPYPTKGRINAIVCISRENLLKFLFSFILPFLSGILSLVSVEKRSCRTSYEVSTDTFNMDKYV